MDAPPPSHLSGSRRVALVEASPPSARPRLSAAAPPSPPSACDKSTPPASACETSKPRRHCVADKPLHAHPKVAATAEQKVAASVGAKLCPGCTAPHGEISLPPNSHTPSMRARCASENLSSTLEQIVHSRHKEHSASGDLSGSGHSHASHNEAHANAHSKSPGRVAIGTLRKCAQLVHQPSHHPDHHHHHPVRRAPKSQFESLAYESAENEILGSLAMSEPAV